MSEPTREEMLAWWDGQYMSKCPNPSCREAMIRGTIRRLIEARPMSKEFWHTWSGRIQDDYNLGSMHVIYLVESMLRELGHEMKEKKEVR